MKHYHYLDHNLGKNPKACYRFPPPLAIPSTFSNIVFIFFNITFAQLDQIDRHKFAIFTKHPLRRRKPKSSTVFFSAQMNIQVFGSDSVLDLMLNNAKGEQWKFLRVFMSPAFSTGKLKLVCWFFIL